MKSYRFPFLDLGEINRGYYSGLCEAAERVIASGRYIGGEEVERLECEMAEMCRAPYAVGVSNGLDALRLIMTAWVETGLLSRDDGVIVAANTYIASILAIIHSGLRPVLVDPDEKTFNLSAEGVEKACLADGGAKAVMPVHLYGRVAWDKDLREIVTRKELLVIEDAAQAIGAIAPGPGLFGSRHAGALGHAGAFSFYPTKNIGALGDGGIVVTHSKRIADTVRALANYGKTFQFRNEYAGFNCRLDPLQAAMLRVKLGDTRNVNARRFERAVAYNNVISHPLVIKPEITPQVTDQVWHQYVVRILEGRRDRMRLYLADNGVETARHYPVPPHCQPCLRSLPHSPLPVTEKLASEILSLPISDCTPVADAAAIGRIINSFNQ